MTAGVLVTGTGNARGELSVAFVASAACHGLVALALALWLVPGQRSALPLSEAPLVVVVRPAPSFVAEAAPPAVESAAATPEPVTLARAAAAVSPRSTVTTEATPDPAASAPAKEPRPVDAAPLTSRPASAAPAAIASGTTTLDVDHGASASIALDALAARASGDDFPAEVGKPVRLRRAPPVTYPQAALERQARGSVLALVIVDAQGMPEDISILQFEPEFVPAAEAALRETRFDPAEDMNGTPIRFYALVRISFLGSGPGNAGGPR